MEKAVEGNGRKVKLKISKFTFEAESKLRIRQGRLFAIKYCDDFKNNNRRRGTRR